MILMLAGHLALSELSVPSTQFGMAVFIEEHFKLSFLCPLLTTNAPSWRNKIFTEEMQSLKCFLASGDEFWSL